MRVAGRAPRDRRPVASRTVRVAALYDIHGNLPALEAVLADVRREGVDAIVAGGDVLYGPWQRECVERLREAAALFVRGNCERVVLTGESDRDRWCREQLGDLDVDEIAAWPLVREIEVDGLGRVVFCHATPSSDDAIVTRITPDDMVDQALGDVTADVVVCGHTHDSARPIAEQHVVSNPDWNALAAGSADREVAQICQWITILRKAHRQVKPSFTLKNFRDDSPSGCRFDAILHVLNVDSIAGGCVAIHRELQLRLTDEMIIVEVCHPANSAQDGCDLFGLGFQHKKIRAIELNGELTFDAGKRLIDVVLDRLREVCRDAANAREPIVHGFSEFLLILDFPFVAGLESDEKLGVVRTVRVCPIIRRSQLGYHDSGFGKSQQTLADLVDIWLRSLERNPNRELDAQPDVSFVQLREKLFP